MLRTEGEIFGEGWGGHGPEMGNVVRRSRLVEWTIYDENKSEGREILAWRNRKSLLAIRTGAEEVVVQEHPIRLYRL